MTPSPLRHSPFPLCFQPHSPQLLNQDRLLNIFTVWFGKHSWFLLSLLLALCSDLLLRMVVNQGNDALNVQCLRDFSFWSTLVLIRHYLDLGSTSTNWANLQLIFNFLTITNTFFYTQFLWKLPSRKSSSSIGYLTVPLGYQPCSNNIKRKGHQGRHAASSESTKKLHRCFVFR